MCAKLLAIGALALCASAGFANPVTLQNVDRSAYEMYTAHSQSVRGSGLSSLYSDLDPGADGYVAFPDTAIEADGELESAGVADFATGSADKILLEQFVFVGGVNQVGGTVFFDFFDSAGTLIDGFGITLQQEGSFIWTIDLNAPFSILSEGLIRMSVDDENLSGSGSTAAGRWFLGNAGATIGDAGAAEASPDFNFNFALNSSVPAPGSVALLGFGGLVASRRRR